MANVVMRRIHMWWQGYVPRPPNRTASRHEESCRMPVTKGWEVYKLRNRTVYIGRKAIGSEIGDTKGI